MRTEPEWVETGRLCSCTGYLRYTEDSTRYPRRYVPPDDGRVAPSAGWATSSPPPPLPPLPFFSRLIPNSPSYTLIS
ncbi:hypothetical protein N7475_005126 [Penicillium sp. IBT 31633x]|nr:hypothetical protein N7475_005126 [Penicillium sp. IBT 31633x]